MTYTPDKLFNTYAAVIDEIAAERTRQEIKFGGAASDDARKTPEDWCNDIEAFQFRDLRAKAATDKAESTGDIRQAQKQLGHTTIAMTEHYTRDRRGDTVKPTR